MLKSLEGYKLGVWVAHGEGCFELMYPESEYAIAAKYVYSEYPGNPTDRIMPLRLCVPKTVVIWQ